MNDLKPEVRNRKWKCFGLHNSWHCCNWPWCWRDASARDMFTYVKRCHHAVFLFSILSYLSIEHSTVNCFQITRGEPSTEFVASDSYDFGLFTYQGRIFNSYCDGYLEGNRCSCNWGRTFVTVPNGTNFIPKCFEAYNDVFGINFSSNLL